MSVTNPMQTNSKKSLTSPQAFSGCGLGGALSRVIAKRSVWVCSCGYTVPKKAAVLSGYASCSQGFHVHYPKCGKVIAQFVHPKQQVGH